MTDYKFCETTDVIALTRIGEGYAKYDGIIQRLLPLVANQIQNFCRRTFIPQSYTEYYPTPERHHAPFKVWLNELNMQQSPNPSVQLDYDFPFDWSTVPQLDPTLYRINYTNSSITLLCDLTEHNEALKIQYTAGYSLDTNDPTLVLVPPAIEQASALQAAFLLGMIVNKDMGQTVKNAQGTHKTLGLDKASREGLIPEAQGLVIPYRRQLVSKIY